MQRNLHPSCVLLFSGSWISPQLAIIYRICANHVTSGVAPFTLIPGDICLHLKPWSVDSVLIAEKFLHKHAVFLTDRRYLFLVDPKSVIFSRKMDLKSHGG